jgi:small-conductance mechanosensitive channel
LDPAAAGLAALVVAFAAYPILKNLVAGVQIVMTHPFRIGDTVEVKGQTGKMEDITASSVVMRLLDERRLIVPLYLFMEKAFQNLTRGDAGIVETVTIHTPSSAPVEWVREKFAEIVKNDPLWNGKVADLQVTDAKEGRLELRGSTSSSGRWNSSWASDAHAARWRTSPGLRQMPGNRPAAKRVLAASLL